jgi:GDPmannose 4,6-dehydratase
MKKALITGISGQDGSFLARLLLKKGYKVYGGIRKNFSNTWRLKKLAIESQIIFIDFDISNPILVQEEIQKIKPDELYNLGSQSSVGKSYEIPIETNLTNGIGVLYILEAIRKFSPNTHFFQAGSTEMFGTEGDTAHTEESPLLPKNPYSTSKTYAFHLTKNYRELYNIFAVNGILFNHESELRGADFFSRKVSSNIAKYSLGYKEILEVGNISVYRDIGYAPEFVDAIYLSLQHSKAEDFIIATGKITQLKKFIEFSYQTIGIDLYWEGIGILEKGFNRTNGDMIVCINPNFFRTNDSNYHKGNPDKIFKTLGWKSQKSIQDIARIMVEFDINEFKR